MSDDVFPDIELFLFIPEIYDYLIMLIHSVPDMDLLSWLHQMVRDYEDLAIIFFPVREKLENFVDVTFRYECEPLTSFAFSKH